MNIDFSNSTKKALARQPELIEKVSSFEFQATLVDAQILVEQAFIANPNITYQEMEVLIKTFPLSVKKVFRGVFNSFRTKQAKIQELLCNSKWRKNRD